MYPESSDGGEIATFSREEAHWPALLGTERQDGFVRDGVSRVGQSYPNIVCGQPGICVQEIFDPRTLRELAQEKLDGDPCGARARRNDSGTAAAVLGGRSAKRQSAEPRFEIKATQ